MSTSSSSSSSDSDVEVIHRPRVFRDRNNPLTLFNDVEFKMRYRVSKIAFQHIVNEIAENLVANTNRNHPITPELQVAVALRFYATGSFQSLLGDQVNISKSSVYRIIRRVTHYVALLKDQFIEMPQQHEVLTCKQEFFNLGGFPGVIGAIDCTHIPIQSPGGPNAELFRNRKGYFSINIQVVADAKLRILNVVARWRGSVHDSTIFNNSQLRAKFEAHEYPNCYLLGDNGYPCSNYLLTPLINCTTQAEQQYNNVHKATRNVVERTFGVLKRRFPCLALGLRTKLSTTLAIIVATCTMHNIALLLNDDVPDIDPEINIPVYEDAAPVENNMGNNATRTALINRIFQ